jgi:hypothetical protein
MRGPGARSAQRDLDDAYLTNALLDGHGDDPAFGYRVLADEVACAGLVAGERGSGAFATGRRSGGLPCRRAAGKVASPAAHDPIPTASFKIALVSPRGLDHRVTAAIDGPRRLRQTTKAAMDSSWACCRRSRPEPPALVHPR